MSNPGFWEWLKDSTRNFLNSENWGLLKFLACIIGGVCMVAISITFVIVVKDILSLFIAVPMFILGLLLDIYGLYILETS